MRLEFQKKNIFLTNKNISLNLKLPVLRRTWLCSGNGWKRENDNLLRGVMNTMTNIIVTN